MRRALYVLALAIVLAIVAAVVYTARARGVRVSAATGGAPAPRAMPGMTSDNTQPHMGDSTITPRGPITIDPRRQQLIGVRTVPVTHEPMQQTVRTVGVVPYDETRPADINLRVEGWIRDLYVDYTGQPIQKGQPLFTLYSPDLLTTQQEYLLALKTRDQVQGSVIAEARDRADQLVAAACQRLSLWDLPQDEIRA